jgi:Protein of unknown function (DUF1360)
MLILSLVVAALAVTRLTRLLVEDRITVKFRQRVLKRWGEESLPSYFIHCPWCMSIWVAALIMPVAAIWPNQWVIAILAIPAASLVAGLVLAGKE